MAMWYEEIYEVANIRAVVAVHRNIPTNIQIELNDLIVYNYDKFIFNCDLFDAAMDLLHGGYLPHQDKLYYTKLNKNLKKSSTQLKESALKYIECRDPDDIIVMVFLDNKIIGTMTLIPFMKKADINGRQYVRSDVFESIPDMPGLEIGRLAKGPQKDLLSSAAMTTAFIITEKWVFRNNILPKKSFVCGETHKYVIDGLSLFFPIVSIPTRLNFQILKHPLGMHFLQRDVIGSIPSTKYLIQLIKDMNRPNITGLIERGTGKSINSFKPEKYQIYLFYFTYWHPYVQEGFKKMDKMIKELTNEKQ